MILVLALIFVSVSQAMSSLHKEALETSTFTAETLATRLYELQHAGWCAGFFNTPLTKVQALAKTQTVVTTKLCPVWVHNNDANCAALVYSVSQNLDNFYTANTDNDQVVTKDECETFFMNNCYTYSTNCGTEFALPDGLPAPQRAVLMNPTNDMLTMASILRNMQNRFWCRTFFETPLTQLEAEVKMATLVVGNFCPALGWRDDQDNCSELLAEVRTGMVHFPAADADANHQITQAECEDHFDAQCASGTRCPPNNTCGSPQERAALGAAMQGAQTYWTNQIQNVLPPLIAQEQENQGYTPPAEEPTDNAGPEHRRRH